MNTIVETLYQHKACRVFTDEPVLDAIKQEIILAAIQALGLRSCYIKDIIENYEFHKDLLKLPKAV